MAAELRARREAKKLTKYALAKRARISREMVARVENQQSKPTVDLVERLCAALGQTLARQFACIARRR